MNDSSPIIYDGKNYEVKFKYIQLHNVFLIFIKNKIMDIEGQIGEVLGTPRRDQKNVFHVHKLTEEEKEFRDCAKNLQIVLKYLNNL